jgi:hypothetical protein
MPHRSPVSKQHDGGGCLSVQPTPRNVQGSGKGHDTPAACARLPYEATAGRRMPRRWAIFRYGDVNLDMMQRVPHGHIGGYTDQLFGLAVEQRLVTMLGLPPVITPLVGEAGAKQASRGGRLCWLPGQDANLGLGERQSFLGFLRTAGQCAETNRCTFSGVCGVCGRNPHSTRHPQSQVKHTLSRLLGV